jgi:hypothetical protein
MQTQTLDRELLAHALAIAGTRQRLASDIEVTLDELDRCLRGEAALPQEAFIATLEVISPTGARLKRDADETTASANDEHPAHPGMQAA